MAGHTGPGGMTVLPHRAVAKLDLRLVPDMTFNGAVAALKAGGLPAAALARLADRRRVDDRQHLRQVAAEPAEEGVRVSCFSDALMAMMPATQGMLAPSG